MQLINSPRSIYPPKHWYIKRIPVIPNLLDVCMGNTKRFTDLLHSLYYICMNICFDISGINLARVTGARRIIDLKTSWEEFDKPLLVHAFRYGNHPVYNLHMSFFECPLPISLNCKSTTTYDDSARYSRPIS